MGAIQRYATIKGKTLDEAFKELQREDELERGRDCYSGGWNLASNVVEVSSKVFDRRHSDSDITKHEPAIAKCIRKPIRNTNAIKTRVTNYPNKGTRKWVTKYVGYSGFPMPSPVVCEDSQAKAIQKAREYVEKNPNSRVTIDIEKHLEGKQRVAEIHYKPSSKEADGEWEVFGCMSY